MRPAFLLFPLLLSACATTESYDIVVGNMLNQTEAQLVSEWGVPDKTYETETGEKFLSYENVSMVVWPAQQHFPTRYFWHRDRLKGVHHTSGHAQRRLHHRMRHGFHHDAFYTPTQVTERSCETTFELTNGIVTDYSFKGNDCVR